MKIAFDVSQTGQGKAGCGYWATGLIKHLAEIDHTNEYVLCPTVGDTFRDRRWLATTTRINQGNFRRTRGQWTFTGQRRVWKNARSDLEARLGWPDIVHANNFFSPPGLTKARLVYTLYDLGFLEHPEWTTESNRVGCFESMFRASVEADAIIAISEYSKERFLATFPHYPRDRVRVVYPASRFERYQEAPNPTGMASLKPDQFWLAVGTIEPRKNYVGLLQAYSQVRKLSATSFPLAIAGGPGWLMEEFLEVIRSLHLERDIVRLGYVSDERLCWLYKHCFACVYPSLYEGFGMPVLEAMSLGACVVSSNAGSLPEVVGSAGIKVDPRAPEEIATAMRRLLRDDASRWALKEKGFERAKQFNWTTTAEQTLELYDHVLSRPKYCKEIAQATDR